MTCPTIFYTQKQLINEIEVNDFRSLMHSLELVSWKIDEESKIPTKAQSPKPIGFHFISYPLSYINTLTKITHFQHNLLKRLTVTNPQKPNHHRRTQRRHRQIHHFPSVQ